jgi:serine/threonine protein kinase
MTDFQCGRCGSRIEVADDAALPAECPHCHHALPVLAGIPSTPPTTLDQPPEPEVAPGEWPPNVETRDYPAATPAPASESPSVFDHSQSGDRSARAELCDFLTPAQNLDELGGLGPYRVLKILGAGGMGVVFQALDPHLNRLVALKVMRPALAASDSARKRFLREAQLAAAIQHDHIIPILHVGEDRGVPYLAMPYLEGESLEDRLQREKRLPWSEVLRIGREIAQGLAAAHKRGLIHRDIKPANIWLETTGASATGGRVKILDFGLARTVGSRSSLTQQGAIIGTPAFMAPEQVEGTKVDERCDLFSLGCVLYTMCTGTMAFHRKDMVGTLLAVATHEPTPPDALASGVPAGLSELVMKLLAKNPEERPQSAQDVVEAIQLIGAGAFVSQTEAHASSRREIAAKGPDSTSQDVRDLHRPPKRPRLEIWFYRMLVILVLLFIINAALDPVMVFGKAPNRLLGHLFLPILIVLLVVFCSLIWWLWKLLVKDSERRSGKQLLFITGAILLALVVMVVCFLLVWWLQGVL